MQSFLKIPLLICLFYLIVLPAPFEVFVSPSGNNSNPGTEAAPLKTLNCARDRVLAYKTGDGMIITLLKGMHTIDTALSLTSKHSGTEDAPLIIRGKEGQTATLSGGVELKYENSKPCDDSDITLGIDPAYVENIRKWSFSDLGITDSGFWSMENIKKGIIPRLYYNNTLMKLAQWPDTGYALIDSVLSTIPFETGGSIRDSVGKFIIKDIPINDFKKEFLHIFMHGYWSYDWYDNYEILDSIDTQNSIIIAGLPNNSPYGYRKGQRFYVGNLFSRIDKEGEWAVDPIKKIIYFWPPANINTTTVTMSVNNSCLINVNRSSNVTFQNLVIQNTLSNALQMVACTSCVISNCIIRNVGEYGIIMSNTIKNRIDHCDMYNIGKIPISISGGNRDSLAVSDIVLANNTIHDFAIAKRSWQSGITINTVGCRIINNTIYNAPHSAIIFQGNNHIIEHNYIYDVCSEVPGSAALYTGSDWASRGTIIKSNIIENCKLNNVFSIYLDNMASGIMIYNNIISNVPRGIIIGGGRDNCCVGNIFINTTSWLTADNRGLGWAKVNANTGGTLPTRLAVIPYTDSIWAQTYPALLTILDDDPGSPKGNVVKDNVMYNSGNPSISAENIHYGIFDNNNMFSSFTDDMELEGYGVQEGLNVDTLSPIPLFRMPVVPLVRNAFSRAGSIYVACVPSYYSDSLKARVVNLLTGETCNGSGGDTVVFSGLPKGSYVYRLWYTGIPYQDSTFSAQDTVQCSPADSTTPEDSTPPRNNFILSGKVIDSGTISLTWRADGEVDDDISRIGLWYNGSGFPSPSHFSESVNAGIWEATKTSDSILIRNLDADKPYYFALLVTDEYSNWSEPSADAEVRIRTPLSGGVMKGTRITIDGTTKQSLFSDSLQLWGDGLSTAYIDTVDRWDPPPTDGFMVFGPALSFRNGMTPTGVKISFSLKYDTPGSPYDETDILIYRYNIYTASWRRETTEPMYDTMNNTINFTLDDLRFPVIPMIDTVAPHINGLQYDTMAYSVSEPITDSFSVSDNIENPEITLLAAPGASGYSDISHNVKSRNKANTYVSTIPANVADHRSGLRSLLIVSDGRNCDTINLSRRIRRDETNCDDEKVTAMQWTPLLVTAQPEKNTLARVLAGAYDQEDFSYDNRNERILQWLPNSGNNYLVDKWVEYRDEDREDFIFEPGKVFWIKTKSDLTLQYGRAVIPSLIDTFEVVLKKDEWTEFSIPYKFDIYSGDITGATGHTSTIELYQWIKGETAYSTKALYLPGIDEVSDPSTVFSGATAYTAFNDGDDDIVLRIPPVCTLLSLINKKGGLEKKASLSPSWSIKLCFRDNAGNDLSSVYCTEIPENGHPRFYRFAPALLQTAVKIVDPETGKRYGHAATGDLSIGGTSFVMSYENQSDKASVITAAIQKVTGLPEGMEAILYQAGDRMDASQLTEPAISVSARQKNTGYLLVGSREYITDFIRNINAVFSFSPLTVNNTLKIHYTLPAGVKKAYVSIFDLNGRCLDKVVLTSGLYAGAGLLTIKKRFPSGYYIVQMAIETVAATNSKTSVLNRRWMFIR